MAKALDNTVRQWKLENCISMCFDTIASNTGKRNGTYLISEQMLKKDRLSLASCHHVTLLQKIFLVTMSPSTGPDIKLFMKFRSYCPQLEISDYQSVMKDKEVGIALQSVTKDIIQFCLQQMKEKQP